MIPVVVYDANILYPSLLRDLMLRLGGSNLFKARWTEEILDEMVRSITRNRPELEKRIMRTRFNMIQTMRKALISNYEHLIPELQLPDPDDRHVLAAAIRCGAHTIVTDNLKDFPVNILSKYDIIPLSSDQFLCNLLKGDPTAVIRVLGDQSVNLTNPPIAIGELLDSLANNHIPEAVEAIWDFLKS